MKWVGYRGPWCVGIDCEVYLEDDFYLLTGKILRLVNNYLENRLQWNESHPNGI